MYNLYLFEKQKNEEKQKQCESERQKNYEKRHKKQLIQLTSNYKKRIENFLYEMASHPVIINEPIHDKTKSTKSSLSKNFSFKTFQTDKQRVEAYLKEHYYENEYYNSKQKILKTSKSQICYNTLYQPSMRFKPRNDIERICDCLTANYGKISKEFITKQLNKVSPKAMLVEPKKIENRKSFKEEKEAINVLKSKKDNSHIVKAMTKNYHTKTFFNAASQFMINSNDYDETKEFDLDEMGDRVKSTSATKESLTKSFINFKGMDKTKRRHRYKRRRIQSEIEHLDFNGTEEDEIFDNKERYNSPSLKRIFKLKLPQNPYLEMRNISQKEIGDEKTMNYLKKLSLSPNLVSIDTASSVRTKKRGNVDYTSLKQKYNVEMYNKKDLKLNINPIAYCENSQIFRGGDSEHILIDNELFNKSDLKKISQKVLKKCRFINDKYDKTESTNWSNKGKTMITNGLTVSEFLSRYSLPQIKQNLSS